MATITRVSEIQVNTNEVTYDLGYKELDKVLGGLTASNIITIGCRPAMGKSTFINNVVLNLLEKYNLPTLYVNLSEVKERCIFRIATPLFEKSYDELRDNEDLKTECINRLIDKKYNLYISDDCYKIDELELLIEENRDIKFLVIDYIQLMGSNREFNSKTDEFNDVLNRLRLLSNKYGLIIFLLSQISRSVERRLDNRPLMADLSSSGNIEYISDVVILLYRDSYYNRSGNTIMEVIVSKNKNGSCWTVCLDYDKNKTKLIDYIDY